jgi:hypothetical protein
MLRYCICAIFHASLDNLFIKFETLEERRSEEPSETCRRDENSKGNPPNSYTYMHN